MTNESKHTHTHVSVHLVEHMLALSLGSEISWRQSLCFPKSHVHSHLCPVFPGCPHSMAEPQTICSETNRSPTTCCRSVSQLWQFFLAFNEIPFYFSRYDSPRTSRAYFLLELGQLMTNNDGESIDRREILGEKLNESLR